jgi:hypothetical protein
LIYRYGPHKIAKVLHHAFCEPNTKVAHPETNGINGNGLRNSFELKAESIPPESISLPPGQVFQTPETHDFTTPTAETPIEIPTPVDTSIYDRRTSIDTSIIKTDGIRVLLVEDNEINLKLLVAYMRKLKLNHATAINGLEALNTYKEAKGSFDVIFMGSFPLRPPPFIYILTNPKFRYLHAHNDRHRKHTPHPKIRT